MAYQKHTWVTNEIIRGKQLNNVEDGIYNEEQRALNAEEALRQSLSDETTRATTREDTIATSIVTLSNNLGEQINTNTAAIAVLNGSGEGSVDYKIAQAISQTGGFKITQDHTAEIDPSTRYIYLEKDSTATGDDKYKEWIYVYDDETSTYSWELIGDTSLDLSEYAKKEDIHEYTLPNASTTELGGIKVGENLTIDTDGTLNASGGVDITIDNELSTTSTNPVQNKIITSALKDRVPQLNSAPTYSTLAELWTAADSLLGKTNSLFGIIRCKISTDFGMGTGWFRLQISAQNRLGNGSYGIGGSIIQDSGTVLNYYSVTGGKTDTSDLAITKVFTSTKDTTPTAGSTNLITSGAVYSQVDTLNTAINNARDFKLGTSRSAATNNILYFIRSS